MVNKPNLLWYNGLVNSVTSSFERIISQFKLGADISRFRSTLRNHWKLAFSPEDKLLIVNLSQLPSGSATWRSELKGQQHIQNADIGGLRADSA